MKRIKALIMIPFAGAFSLLSCEQTELNAPRKESIEIHALADCSDEPLEAYCLGVEGGNADLYVKTNVEDFNAFWQDAAGTPWAEVTSCEETDVKGVWHLTLNHSDRSSDCLYYRRGGMLSVSAPDLNLGNFLPVYQGAASRVQDHFSDFVYGSWNPQVTDGETHISKWSTTLTAKGFTSETISGDTEPRCYARNGCLKIGDGEGHKGNLLTPYNELYRYDSLLMVTFRAAAYQDEMGMKDDASFTVEIVGGGVLRDDVTRTSMTLEAPYVNPWAETAGQVWPQDSWFMVFFTETEASQLSVNTRIRFTSGASGMTESGCSRIFIDDVCVMRLVDGLDEDFYTKNNGSGHDSILAVRTTLE